MSEKLKEAALLYNKGDKPQALKLLAEIVKQEPNNLDAWYGLALCLDDHDKRVYCLIRVLSLDPSHKKAQQSLEKLLVKEKSSNYQETAESQPLPVAKKKSPFSWQTVSILGISGTILICVIIIGVALIGRNLYNSVPALVPPTSTPTIKLYNKEAATYLERITQMPNEFQIDYSKDMHGDVLNDSKTTKIATFAARTFMNPNYPQDEISGVIYSLFVFDDIEEAKVDFDEETRKFASSKSFIGQFDDGVYEIGIYDKDAHLIYIDKIIRKSNVVARIYCLAILSENTDSVSLVAWSLYYENLMLSSIQ